MHDCPINILLEGVESRPHDSECTANVFVYFQMKNKKYFFVYVQIRILTMTNNGKV